MAGISLVNYCKYYCRAAAKLPFGAKGLVSIRMPRIDLPVGGGDGGSGPIKKEFNNITIDAFCLGLELDADPQKVHSFIKLLRSKGSYSAWTANPTFFADMMRNNEIADVLLEKAEKIADEFSLPIDISILFAAKGRDIEKIKSDLEAALGICEGQKIFFFDACLAILTKSPQKTAKSIKAQEKYIDLDNYDSKYYPDFEHGYIEHIDSIRPALKGRFEFNRQNEWDLLEYKSYFGERLIISIVKALQLQERPWWNSRGGRSETAMAEDFIKIAIFELLKNAYRHSKNGKAYIEWQVDTYNRRIKFRVINKSDGTYHPSNKVKNRYKLFSSKDEVFDEVHAHHLELDANGEKVDEWGGNNRGVSLAHYFSTELKYLSIYDKSQRDYFGTGAAASLQL